MNKELEYVREIKEFGKVTVITESSIKNFSNLKVRINWSGIGAVNLKDAKNFFSDFKNALMYAEEIIEKYKNMGYIIVE